MKSFSIKIIFLFLFWFIYIVNCDEFAMKTKLKDCFSKEMDKENSASSFDLKLNDQQLKEFKKIVHNEIDKEPLKKHTPEEQKKSYKDMEDAAKKSIPEVKQEAIDKILHKIHDMFMHCLYEMGS